MPSPEADTRREEEGHLERFCRDGALIFHGVFRHLGRSSWRGGGSVRYCWHVSSEHCLPSLLVQPPLVGMVGSAGVVFTANTVAAISLGAELSQWQPPLLPLPPGEPSPPSCPPSDSVVGRGRVACSSPQVPSALLLLASLLSVGGSPRDLPSLDGALR